MEIAVYDTYATLTNGETIHFDVLLPSSDSSKEDAERYAQNFIKDIGQSANSTTLDRCNFCHTETANPEIKNHIDEAGYFILQMENCPAPYGK